MDKYIKLLKELEDEDSSFSYLLNCGYKDKNLSLTEIDSDNHGDGNYIHRVIKIESEKETRYFKETGTYSSWDDSSWNRDWREVRPKEKIITVYE